MEQMFRRLVGQGYEPLHRTDRFEPDTHANPDADCAFDDHDDHDHDLHVDVDLPGQPLRLGNDAE